VIINHQQWHQLSCFGLGGKRKSAMRFDQPWKLMAATLFDSPGICLYSGRIIAQTIGLRMRPEFGASQGAMVGLLTGTRLTT